jgi:ACS family sodium-dependent inorganic phosphate cotransporter
VIVVLMCFAANVICYLDRVSMATAAVPMADHYGWTATTKGLVLSSFFIGYMLMQIPGGWFSNRVGGRLVLGVSLIWWSIVTMITPAAAALSVGVLIAARIAMGVGEASCVPAMYNLAARWLPQHERSRAITLMVGGVPIGTVVGLLLSGLLLDHLPWPAMFHLFGAGGLLFVLLWFYLVRQGPGSHPRISAQERAMLEADASILHEAAAPRAVPWGLLLSKPAVWALIFNHFCSTWALYVAMNWLPTYFKSLGSLGMGSAGLLSAAPFLILFLASNVVAVVADRAVRRGVSVTLVRKTAQITGLVGCAAFLLAACWSTTPLGSVALLCGALGLLGFTWSGFGPNHLDIAPRYADVLSGITNTAGALPGVLGVVVTGWIVDRTGSFAGAFQLSAAVCVAGAVIWLLWGTGRRVVD